MKKMPNKVKKSQQQLHRYKNMVKYKTEDEYTDNDEIFIKDLQGTNETIDDVNAMAVKTENKIQEPPLSYKAKEFFESYFTQILITAILGLAGWSVSLQIGQAIQNEKIQNIEENIKEIRTFIEDKYIMKDLHDVQIENLKEKINELEEEINNLKK